MDHSESIQDKYGETYTLTVDEGRLENEITVFRILKSGCCSEIGHAHVVAHETSFELSDIFIDTAVRVPPKSCGVTLPQWFRLLCDKQYDTENFRERGLGTVLLAKVIARIRLTGRELFGAMHGDLARLGKWYAHHGFHASSNRITLQFNKNLKSLNCYS